MKRITKAVLNALPLVANRAAVPDERMLDLFRNRVELKKDYVALQTELQNCKDRLKQQEGALARAQESMAALEARLTRPEAGAAAMVYYQFRDLWAYASQLLEQFVEQRRVQRESLERAQFERDTQVEGIRRMATVDAELNLASDAAAEARSGVQEVEQQLRDANRWWHYFKRRKLQTMLQAATAQAAIADIELNAIVAKREALVAEEATEFPGLSVAAKRSVNCLAVAYAHIMFVRLSGSPVYEAASQAVRLREPPVKGYGDFNACRLLMKEIQHARAILNQKDTLREEIQAAVRLIADKLLYKTEDVGLPDGDVLAGDDTAPGIRVLKDNIWQINRLLLR